MECELLRACAAGEQAPLERTDTLRLARERLTQLVAPPVDWASSVDTDAHATHANDVVETELLVSEASELPPSAVEPAESDDQGDAAALEAAVRAEEAERLRLLDAEAEHAAALAEQERALREARAENERLRRAQEEEREQQQQQRNQQQQQQRHQQRNNQQKQNDNFSHGATAERSLISLIGNSIVGCVWLPVLLLWFSIDAAIYYGEDKGIMWGMMLYSSSFCFYKFTKNIVVSNNFSLCVMFLTLATMSESGNVLVKLAWVNRLSALADAARRALLAAVAYLALRCGGSPLCASVPSAAFLASGWRAESVRQCGECCAMHIFVAVCVARALWMLAQTARLGKTEVPKNGWARFLRGLPWIAGANKSWNVLFLLLLLGWPSLWVHTATQLFLVEVVASLSGVLSTALDVFYNPEGDNQSVDASFPYLLLHICRIMAMFSVFIQNQVCFFFEFRGGLVVIICFI